MESTRQVNAILTKTTALFGWMGITGNDKQQQCEACGTLDQKMKLRWVHGNLKLSLKLLTTLDNSMEVTETLYGIHPTRGLSAVRRVLHRLHSVRRAELMFKQDKRCQSGRKLLSPELEAAR